MARPMRMKDKKNYNRRIHSPQTGNASGASMTDRSRYLSYKYDMEHGSMIDEYKKKFVEEYEKTQKV